MTGSARKKAKKGSGSGGAGMVPGMQSFPASMAPFMPPFGFGLQMPPAAPFALNLTYGFTTLVDGRGGGGAQAEMPTSLPMMSMAPPPSSAFPFIPMSTSFAAASPPTSTATTNSQPSSLMSTDQSPSYSSTSQEADPLAAMRQWMSGMGTGSGPMGGVGGGMMPGMMGLMMPAMAQQQMAAMSAMPLAFQQMMAAQMAAAMGPQLPQGKGKKRKKKSSKQRDASAEDRREPSDPATIELVTSQTVSHKSFSYLKANPSALKLEIFDDVDPDWVRKKAARGYSSARIADLIIEDHHVPKISKSSSSFAGKDLDSKADRASSSSSCPSASPILSSSEAPCSSKSKSSIPKQPASCSSLSAALKEWNSSPAAASPPSPPPPSPVAATSSSPPHATPAAAQAPPPAEPPYSPGSREEQREATSPDIEVEPSQPSAPEAVDFLAQPAVAKTNAAYKRDAANQLYYYFPVISLNSIHDVLESCGHNFALAYVTLWEELGREEWKARLRPPRSAKPYPTTRPIHVTIQGLSSANIISELITVKAARVYSSRPPVSPHLRAEMEWLRAKGLVSAAHQVPTRSSVKSLKQECTICYEERLAERFRGCRDGHQFCVDCLKAQARELVHGQGAAELRCLEPGCKAGYSRAIEAQVLEPQLLARMDERETQQAVAAAGLAVEQCVKCSWGALLETEPEMDIVFFCGNGECRARQCRLCRRPWTDEHVGRRCEELLSEDERKQREEEEQMTLAVIRACHRCGLRFQKSSGCNKMTCSCGATSCYLCRAHDITYAHFCRHQRGAGQGCEVCRKCALFSDADEADNPRLHRPIL